MNAPRPNAAGIRVAVTRDEPADGPLSTALREHGLEPVACPAVRELPAPDPIALRESALAADGYDWIIAASTRAVRALIDARGGRALAPRLKAGAVGGATAEALRQSGLTDVVVAAEPGAEGLLRELLRSRSFRGERVLLPRAAEGRDVLASGLREAGASVDEVVAYVTAAEIEDSIRETWERERPAAAVIASPSAARALADAVGIDTLCALAAIVAIGPTTGAALASLGIPSRRAADASFDAAAAEMAEALGAREVKP
ncbi:MAG TPA: uroporphyrinogen-III synthase [Candidatus Udaeobacter sp.]|jgi:uroporphyrinogen-III synthase|nr:uroporphyrinogen-III synthase [Candidatus Udaeobacter sp.]